MHLLVTFQPNPCLPLAHPTSPRPAVLQEEIDVFAEENGLEYVEVSLHLHTPLQPLS